MNESTAAAQMILIPRKTVKNQIDGAKSIKKRFRRNVNYVYVSTIVWRHLLKLSLNLSWFPKVQGIRIADYSCAVVLLKVVSSIPSHA